MSRLQRKTAKLINLIEEMPASEQRAVTLLLAESILKDVIAVEMSSEQLSNEYHELIEKCTCLEPDELRSVMGLNPRKRS